MKSIETIVCANSMNELDRIVQWMEEIAEKWELAPGIVFNLNLVIEEAFTNIVNYAFTDQQKHTIEILMEIENQVLTVRITDEGKAYDPTLKEDPDITLRAEEREIGGLGIFLIRKIMDKVEYQRIDNKNVFTMWKKL